MQEEQRSQPCPICNGETPYSQRYPRHVCRACLAEGVEVNGKTSPLEEVDVYYRPVRCTVKGVRCIAEEAHFGGIVVNVEAPAE